MKDNLSLKIALGIILGMVGLVALGVLCCCALFVLLPSSLQAPIGSPTLAFPSFNPTPTELPLADIGSTFDITGANLSMSLLDWKESPIAIGGPYTSNRYYAFSAKPGMKFVILIFKFRNNGVRTQQSPYLSEGEVQTDLGFFYSVWHPPAGISSDEYKPRIATDVEIKKLVGDSVAFMNLLPQQESGLGRVVFEIPQDAKPTEAKLKVLPVRVRFSGTPSP